MTSSEPSGRDGRESWGPQRVPTFQSLMASAAAVALVVLGTFGVWLQLREVSEVRADPRTYELVYHEPAAVLIDKSYRAAWGSLLVTAIGLLRFVDRRRRRLWGIVSSALLLVFVALLIGGMIEWARSGFDHP